MAKPPGGVDDVFAATLVLLAGIHPNVQIQKNGASGLSMHTIDGAFVLQPGAMC